MVRLRDELDREREERNFFQLERDKVNTFWDISKRQLEEAKSTVRNKERELEDAEERHQVEIKVGAGMALFIVMSTWTLKAIVHNNIMTNSYTGKTETVFYATTCQIGLVYHSNNAPINELPHYGQYTGHTGGTQSALYRGIWHLPDDCTVHLCWYNYAHS